MTYHVPFPQPCLRATLLRRYKRFFADMELNGGVVTAHCANTGSMLGLLQPGAPCLLWDSADPRRTLRHSWKAVAANGTWVGIDTALPNGLVAGSLQSGVLEAFSGVTAVERERKMGSNSRVDVVAHGPWGQAWIEVKNVTLADRGVARFPDAVTERGRKHLHELQDRVAEGHRAAMVYVVQRGDCDVVEPADAIDPAYGAALRAAVRAGVEVYALGCEVREDGVHVRGPLPVRL